MGGGGGGIVSRFTDRHGTDTFPLVMGVTYGYHVPGFYGDFVQ